MSELREKRFFDYPKLLRAGLLLRARVLRRETDWRSSRKGRGWWGASAQLENIQQCSAVYTHTRASLSHCTREHWDTLSKKRIMQIHSMIIFSCNDFSAIGTCQNWFKCSLLIYFYLFIAFTRKRKKDKGCTARHASHVQLHTLSLIAWAWQWARQSSCQHSFRCPSVSLFSDVMVWCFGGISPVPVWVNDCAKLMIRQCHGNGDSMADSRVMTVKALICPRSGLSHIKVQWGHTKNCSGEHVVASSELLILILQQAYE